MTKVRIEASKVEVLGKVLTRKLLEEERETNDINGITIIRAYYQGSYYDSKYNLLKVGLNISKSKIGDRVKNTEEDVRAKEYIVNFGKDYSNATSSHFDSILNGIESKLSEGRNMVLLNIEDSYYTLIQEILNMLSNIEKVGVRKGHTEQTINHIITRVKGVEGITYKDKNKIKTILPILIGSEYVYGLVTVEEEKGRVILTQYKGGTKDKIQYKLTSTQSGNRLEVNKFKFNRYPNHTNIVLNKLKERELDNLELMRGDKSRRRNMYLRNINRINTLGKDFVNESNVFKNKYNEYIKVEIKKTNTKPTIQFNILKEDNVGIKAGEYRLGTVFNGGFYNLSLDSSKDSWVVDSVLMKEIYESMVEGKGLI